MFNLVEKELKKREKFSETENGAIGYKSSGSALLDLNYAVSSLRSSSEEEIIDLFDKAFYENPEYTLKWLFYARDIREGLGERRLFRICYRRLLQFSPEAFFNNLKHISEFGRWDDLVSLVGIEREVDDYVINHIIRKQLNKDLKCLVENEPISLLAKWLPSENASSKRTKLSAKKIRSLLKISAKDYRLMLSALRKHSNVVEVQMCNNDWENIDYESVPSLANLKYKDAFLRHDRDRRHKYLNSVEKGTAKFNMKVATPVDIVSMYYASGFYSRRLKSLDTTLELAWKNLKDVSVEETLVVADGSGSMTVKVDPSSSASALSVANALAIYTSEHNKGVYKDKYVTFSRTPQFVDLTSAESLQEKLSIANKHSEVANTNIEAVFDLILQVAIKNDIPRDKMIKNILIISDMEFDSATGGYFNQSLFETIEDKYNKYGYRLPKLIFWNVNSRTKTIPVIENDLGVILVSGFSQNVLNMVMSNKLDPYEALIEVLDRKRYSHIVL